MCELLEKDECCRLAGRRNPTWFSVSGPKSPKHHFVDVSYSLTFYTKLKKCSIVTTTVLSKHSHYHTNRVTFTWLFSPSTIQGWKWTYSQREKNVGRFLVQFNHTTDPKFWCWAFLKLLSLASDIIDHKAKALTVPTCTFSVAAPLRFASNPLQKK